MRKKNNERPTTCIRNSGFSAKSKVSAFNKSKCQTESEVLLNPLLLIHAKRYQASLRKKDSNMKIDKTTYKDRRRKIKSE
jgi:hypothetical protein